jgi:hypothetical protein
MQLIGGETPTNGAAETLAMFPYVASVTIEGKAAFLFHRYNVEEVEAKSAAPKNSKAKKTDAIESYVYRLPNGNLGIPGEYLRMAIINAARFQQDPRSPRKCAMDLYKAAVLTLTEYADLGRSEWDYEDKRRVVVQRSAVPRTRPALLPGWTVTFDFMVQTPEYISPALLNETIQAAGRLVGIGDFRPTYGRFVVTNFEAR